MARRDIFEINADFCRVFSDPKRLRIMWFLADGEQTVTAIAEHLGVSIQNASAQLRVMRDKGAVRFRRQGHAVYYRIANPKFLEACRLICEGLREERSL